MLVELSDEQMFRLLVSEIRQFAGHLAAGHVLMMLVEESNQLAEFCEHCAFVRDDGKLDPQKKFLIDWIKQNANNKELWRKLKGVARQMS